MAEQKQKYKDKKHQNITQFDFPRAQKEVSKYKTDVQ